MRRCNELLLEGERVLVDANFRDEARRRLFLDAATKLGVRTGLLICQADSEIIRMRLANRRDDASDADWSVYLKAAESWEELTPRTHATSQAIDTSRPAEHALTHASSALRKWGLTEL